jgi:tRNA A-37 threonylcarbamoyl transferase component Bud32
LKKAPKRITAGKLNGYIDSEFDKPDFMDFLADPDRAFVDADELLKDSPTTTAAFITAEVGGEPREFHLKRINRKGLSHTVGKLAGQSRAIRNFNNALKLLELGIPTPQPVAAMDERKLRTLKKSYYITIKVQDAFHGYDWLKENFRKLSQPDQSQIIERFAALVREMHFKGVIHGDLKCSNVLILPESKPFTFSITDLDAVSFTKKSWQAGPAAAELARLSLSAYDTIGRDDRTHFLAAYFDAKCDAGGWGMLREFRKLAAAFIRKHIEGQRKKKKYSDDYFKYFESGAGKCPKG